MSPTDPWFENPLDSMPIATDKSGDNYASRHESTPDHEKGAEEIVTMHEKMYRLATKGGKHTLGGGSETIQKQRLFFAKYNSFAKK